MTTSTKQPDRTTTDATSGNQRNVLVIGTDLGLAKTVQNLFAGLKNIDVSFRVFPGTDLEKSTECLNKTPLHSVLVEEEFFADRTSEQFIKTLQEILAKSPLNQKVPLILVAQKTDFEKTKLRVREGWKDLLLKPLDGSLFLQKMNTYQPEQAFLKEQLLFTMDFDHEVDLSFRYTIKTISEYILKIEANESLAVGEVVGINGPSFSEPLAAVTLESTKIADNQYQIKLLFIGITPAETQEIRKLIRQEYAEEKQAA